MSSLNANQKRCFGVWPNEEISYTNASMSGFLSLITIPGNLLVLIVVFKNPNGKMRTPFNWFILNLAVADLLVGMIVEPLSVVVHTRESLGLTLKYHYYLQPVYFTSCTASVFSLGMLTIDRYIAITSPMEYRATLSNKRAAVTSLIVWIISIALPFLQREIGFLWYFFVFGNASVLVTFFVLLFAFVRVHLTLRAQIKELESMQSGSAENQARNNALKTEAMITKTFMFMLLAFIFCYTPSLIMIYLMNLCTVCSCQAIHWFRDLSYVFIVLNSSVNPFLYAWRLPNFREAIKMLFKRNIPQQVTAAPRAVLPSTPQRTGGTTAMTNVSSDNNGATDAQATKDDAQGAKVNQIAICVEERL
jgi:hypothetical protein